MSTAFSSRCDDAMPTLVGRRFGTNAGLVTKTDVRPPQHLEIRPKTDRFEPRLH
jgi:hypothetical protein